MKSIIQIQEHEFYNPSVELRLESERVVDFGKPLQDEIDELISVFHSWKIAVGLSAPQIGIRKRFAVININKDKLGPDFVIVNPIITNQSGKKDIKFESCLSLPNVKGQVERRYKIDLDYQDRFGNNLQTNADSFLARVIMHEIDHLNGILFVDRMADDKKLELANFLWE